MMKVKCVLFNYNLADETDVIYEKLLTDGYPLADIMVVDNGSKPELKSKYTSFSLPFNCRFSGQSSLSLRYLHDYFPADYYLLITTSASLMKEINYHELIERLLIDQEGQIPIGFVVSSLFGGRTEKSAPLQNYDNLISEYTDIYKYQPIVTLLSHRLLSKCIGKESSYFNPGLVRGWGIDRELKYIADSNGMSTLVCRSLKVEWKTNLTHRKGVADESQKMYWTLADKEMQDTFNSKYGYFWKSIFQLTHFYKKSFFLRGGLIPLLVLFGKVASLFRSLISKKL